MKPEDFAQNTPPPAAPTISGIEFDDFDGNAPLDAQPFPVPEPAAPDRPPTAFSAAEFSAMMLKHWEKINGEGETDSPSGWVVPPVPPVPPAPPASPLATIEAVLAKLDQSEVMALLEGIRTKINAAVPSLPVPAAAASRTVTPVSPDRMAAANAARQDAARELESMVWTSGTGERFPLKMTSSRYANYEWLRRFRRGPDAPELISVNEVLASRYLDAGLMLFLCAVPRPPLGEGAGDLLAEAEEWMDVHIPIGRQDESWKMASRIMALTDMFVPVERASADEVLEDDEEVAQKKRPLQGGNPGI